MGVKIMFTCFHDEYHSQEAQAPIERGMRNKQ